MSGTNENINGNDSGVSGSIETIDPNTVVGSGTTEPPKRKRGRPSTGSATGNTAGSSSKSQAKNSENLSGIENLLSGIHVMLAASTGIKELTISDDESKKLAKSIAEVQKHYDFIVDAEVMAWVGLITTCSTIYLPKLAIYSIRVKAETKIKSEGDSLKSSEINPTDKYLAKQPVSQVN